jgi:hypothetical protein
MPNILIKCVIVSYRVSGNQDTGLSPLTTRLRELFIMTNKKAYAQSLASILMAASLVGCTSAPTAAVSTPTPISSAPATVSPTQPPTPDPASPQPTRSPARLSYGFPASIDPAKRYLFYLHGKIIEDQGLPAISPDFGEYEYAAILEKLASYGFVVISEQRPKNTDPVAYAQKIVAQITLLLDAKVPPGQITVVGASKGAAIATLVSYQLKNEQANFVLIGTCHPDTVAEWKQNQITLYGNILSIYDFADHEYSGSCQELFKLSAGKGLARHDEIVLQIGAGHGILYKPLDAWITPTVQWAIQ